MNPNDLDDGEWAIDHGRQIPPPLNPCVPGVIDRIRDGYEGLARWIDDFREEIAELMDVVVMPAPKGVRATPGFDPSLIEIRCH